MNVRSTRMPAPATDRLTGLVATLLTAFLVIAGAITATPAVAAQGPHVAGTISAASESGLSVRIDVAGLDPVLTGAYIGVVPAGGAAAVTADSGTLANDWVRGVSGGAFTATLAIPASALERGAAYEVIVWKQHSVPSAENLYAQAELTVSDADWDAVFGPAAPTPTPTPTAAPAPTPTPTAAPAPTPTPTATPAPTTAPTPTPTPTATPTPAPAPASPTLTVSKSRQLDPTGATITVTGENYDATALGKYGPTAGQPAGVYAQIGWLADTWRPSEGAASSARTNAYSVWVQGSQTEAPYLRWTDNGDGTADFTWTVTIDKATLDAKKLAGGTLAVFTSGAGGVTQAVNEKAVPLTWLDPQLTVSKTTGLNPDAATVTVTGAGYDASALGKYGPTAGQPAGVYAQIGWLADTWRPSEGAASSARTNAYSVWVQSTQTAPPYLKWTDNGDGTADFTWIVTIDKATLDAKKLAGGTLAVFTSGAGGVTQAVNENAVPIAFAESGPALTVSQTSELDPTGATITVTGENYDATALGKYGPTAGQPAGVYAQIGWLADTWRPSEGAASSARTNAYSVWVQSTQTAPPYLKWTNNGDGTADFTWIVTIDKATLDAKKLAGGTLAVFTSGAGGVTQAVNENAVPIAFAEPVDPGIPATTGSLSWSISLSFLGYVQGPIAQGSVAVAGGAERAGDLFTFPQALTGTTYDAATGTGSVGYAGSVRFTGHHGALEMTLANPQIRVASATTATLWVAAGAGQVKLADLDLTPAVRTEKSGVVTFAGATVTLTAEGRAMFDDAYTTLDPLTFTIGAAAVIVTPEPPVTPVTPVTPPSSGGSTPEAPAASVRGGSLRWAISSSFAEYVTGPIAGGAITVSGGATRSGGQFQFGQAAGSTYDAKTGLGTVSYVGAVRFTGHHGVLDVTIANPQIRVTSAASATLYVTAGGSQVAFATLDLRAAAKTVDGSAVTYTAAPAALTGAGLSQVLSGYSTTLNPVTFTIGAPASAPGGSTGTIATASISTPAALPATPPATTGIDVDEDTLDALQAGGQVTIRVPGFQPNESGIAIVVYSTPVLLGTVTADADGVATWTGTLPATLEDGAHTLTFQGSINSGIVFTLDRSAPASAIGVCLAEGASLNWGFKESFRTYLEGIAAGGWQLTDVAYEYPDFVWTDGSGTLDLDARTGLVSYGGGIEFTGHGGALDTLVSNVRLELAGDVGYLVVDVSGATQSGVEVSEKDVRFAEFPLGELTAADGALTLTDLPATLTDAGAAAFGTYGAGEELDPVGAVIPVLADCTVAAVPATDGEDEAVAEPAAPIEADDTAAPVWPWALGGLVLLAAVAAAAVVIARRRRAPGADATA